MSESMENAKELWSNPRVYLTSMDLIIEQYRYHIEETLGAYVDEAPAGSHTAPAKSVTTRTSIGFGIGSIFGGLLSNQRNNGGIGISFSKTSSNAPSGNGDNQLVYRLVLIGQAGPVVALQHTNKRKLEAIASQVNEALILHGVIPITSPR